MRPAICVLLLVAACGAQAASAPAQPVAARAEQASVAAAPASAVAPVAAAPGTRGEVVLVALGAFPDDLMDEVELTLRTRLQVDVRRLDRVALPKRAWYAPRKRYRAEKLLDFLLEQIPDAPPTTRILGLTTADISTTKGDFHDWGIFGLGLTPGQAAVVSSHRLTRKARNREHVRFRVANTALHEAGHTFGLEHCDEPRCPMQDAEGGIAKTDGADAELGRECRGELEAAFPVRSTPASSDPSAATPR